MKHKLTLHYSISNGGDGSASIQLMESAELAQYDQDNMYEGWGESCLGTIELESDSPITVKRSVETKEAYLLDLIDSDNDNVSTFIEEFFPNGLPKFTVELEEIADEKKGYPYIYNIVKIDGMQVDKKFKRKEDSGQVFEDLLNNYVPPERDEEDDDE